MDSNELLQLAVLAIGTIAVGAVVYVLAYPFLSGERKVEKRVKGVTESRASRKKRVTQMEQASQRKQTVADTLKELEERQNKSKKKKVSLRLRLIRAGLDITPRTYWILSLGAGVLSAFGLFIAMPGVSPLALLCVAFIGGLGIPRWTVSFMTKRRQKKFIEEFANAIDVIVRGVKSGLPLNECLGIIARESPEPIRSEFQELVEQQRVGVTLAEGFDRMMHRVPIPEVRFFGIVIGIQQQAGGNLSEALGNLSGVLRDRRQLSNKVQAMSSEAKASAMVLGSLPFCVMMMVYFTTPDYMTLLWTERFGQFLLLIAGFWMMCGVLVMKKMINFKY